MKMLKMPLEIEEESNRIQDADRDYFIAHPNASHYYRPANAVEFWPRELSGKIESWVVLVEEIEPGVRIKTPLKKR